MTYLKSILLLFAVTILAACGTENATPTTLPTLTPFPSPQVQPSRTPIVLPPTVTPFVSNNQSAPTAIVITATPLVSNTGSQGQTNSGDDRLQQNGIGLTNGATMQNGEFQVEGYCTFLNASYGVGENGTDWFCTFQGQRALTLRADDFSEICRLTYNNPNAVAVTINNGQPLAFQWRCYELVIPPTATPSAPPQLLQNGVGMSNGATMNNGEFQVEGYCTAINPNYGVTEDTQNWYCTDNGNRILTLGQAEFDDICIRTYNNPAAFAQQNPNVAQAAYAWRCYAIPS